MSLEIEGSKPIHYPTKADKFEFDSEVTRIFPDMATRSIPMYSEIHRLHVSMLPEFFCRDGAVVVDVGASRGQLFRAICNQLQVDEETGPRHVTGIAVETSEPMLAALEKEFPWVVRLHGDVSGMPDLPCQADAICMFYVLQFIPEEKKRDALRWAWRNLRKGGVLVLGQKEEVDLIHNSAFTDEYYRFRMGNGYSLAEIAAKTEALKGSMFVKSAAWQRETLADMGFRDYIETSRWLQFSTGVCFK